MSSEKKAQPLSDDELEQVSGGFKENELNLMTCARINDVVVSQRNNDMAIGMNLHNVASVSTSITNSNDATR